MLENVPGIKRHDVFPKVMELLEDNLPEKLSHLRCLEMPNIRHPLSMHPWCCWYRVIIMSFKNVGKIGQPGMRLPQLTLTRSLVTIGMQCTLCRLAASSCRCGAKVPTWSTRDTKPGVLPDCPQGLDGEEFGPLMVCQDYV